MMPGRIEAVRSVQIGDALLLCGDCLQILPSLEGVGALITDPPYSSGGMTRGDRMLSTTVKYQSTGVLGEHPNFTGDNRDQRGFLAWSSLWLTQALSATKPGGIAALFSDWRQLPTMTDALQAGGWVWRGIVPWDKVNSRPIPNRFRSQCEYVVWGTSGPRSFKLSGATYHPGILTALPPATASRVHSTQKPLSIMETLCQIAPPGALVLDPFMGSGTTGVARLASGRRFVGIEKDPHYFDVAVRRLSEHLKAA
jgi:site-specific DNA-methyltransferase (adenine-specific)